MTSNRSVRRQEYESPCTSLASTIHERTSAGIGQDGDSVWSVVNSNTLYGHATAGVDPRRVYPQCPASSHTSDTLNRRQVKPYSMIMATLCAMLIHTSHTQPQSCFRYLQPPTRQVSRRGQIRHAHHGHALCDANPHEPYLAPNPVLPILSSHQTQSQTFIPRVKPRVAPPIATSASPAIFATASPDNAPTTRPPPNGLPFRRRITCPTPSAGGNRPRLRHAPAQ
jgi:hypothetical protein